MGRPKQIIAPFGKFQEWALLCDPGRIPVIQLKCEFGFAGAFSRVLIRFTLL